MLPMKPCGIIESGIAALGLVALLALPLGGQAQATWSRTCTNVAIGEGDLEDRIFDLFEPRFSSLPLCAAGCHNAGATCMRIAHTIFLRDLALVGGDASFARLRCQGEVGLAKLACMKEATAENRDDGLQARSFRQDFVAFCELLQDRCVQDCRDE
jgi:hypothetical protein